MAAAASRSCSSTWPRASSTKPDDVRVERAERDGAVVLELHVAEDDLGKVIGRGGRIVRSLRIARPRERREGRRAPAARDRWLSERWVSVGRVGRPHGLRGDFVVERAERGAGAVRGRRPRLRRARAGRGGRVEALGRPPRDPARPARGAGSVLELPALGAAAARGGQLLRVPARRPRRRGGGRARARPRGGGRARRGERRAAPRLRRRASARRGLRARGRSRRRDDRCRAGLRGPEAELRIPRPCSSTSSPSSRTPSLGSPSIGRSRPCSDRELDLRLWSYRDFTPLRAGQVDDEPYGGGAGMVLRVDVSAPRSTPSTATGAAGASSRSRPAAARSTSRSSRSWPPRSELTLLSARFEGFDERVVEHVATDAVSIGPYVLSGGELPAMVLLDAVARRLPGALREESGELESFSEALDGGLEYPHYTRPAEFRGWHVPDVLLSGNHALVETWRREQSRDRSEGGRCAAGRAGGHRVRNPHRPPDRAASRALAVGDRLGAHDRDRDRRRAPDQGVGRQPVPDPVVVHGADAALRALRLDTGCEARFSDRVLANRFIYHFTRSRSAATSSSSTRRPRRCRCDAGGDVREAPHRPAGRADLDAPTASSTSTASRSTSRTSRPARATTRTSRSA